MPTRKSQTELQIHIPLDWQSAADYILQTCLRKILVLGAADRGKSVFCHFLVEQIRAQGFSAAFVDADIGQKDVGLPATISLAHVLEANTLQDAELSACYFIGAVSPARHFLDMIVGTRNMADKARANFVVIDTTGLVHGIGRTLKAAQIESVQPDVIVTLEKDRELDAIAHSHRHFRFLRLNSSRLAAGKSARARRNARERLFNAYFHCARSVTLDIAHLTTQRLALFCGEPIEDSRYVYAEQLPDGVIAISHLQHPPKQPGIHILPLGFERHLLCGLADSSSACLGLGILDSIDYQNRKLALLTPVSKHSIKILQFGDMYVTPEGKELRHGLNATTRS